MYKRDTGGHPLPNSLLHLLIVALLFALTPQALSQESRGTIIGRVTDASADALPGVHVRVVNTATNVIATATTNESGSFNVPFLIPGAYRVTAELNGFKKFIRDNVEVRVAETVELNLHLEIGNVSETTEVRDETPLLDTASPSLGQVIDQRRIQELPILSGNPAEMALLAPGVVNVTDMRLRKAAFNNAPSQIATDGNGQYNNEFTLDGVPNTFASGDSARIAFSPPVYSVREFKIQTSPYDASVGHTIGAVTNISTANGENTYHGEVHLWERNSAFDAPNFFNNKNGTEVPVYQDHRYGASLGGPIVIPKLYNGKNKTFFYYAYEGNKWGTPQTFTGTVPTPKERQGDFSDLLNLGPQYQIYDPFSTRALANGRFMRDPIPGNILKNIDPVAQNLIDLYPLPNLQGTADGRNNYFSASKALEDYYVHIARVDHAFNEKHRMFARVDYDWWQENKNDYFLNRYDALFLNRINKGVALDDVYVINSKMVLNVRYGLTYQSFPERRASRGTDLTSLGFSPALANLVLDQGLATLPRVTIPGYSTIAPWETGDGTNTSMVHSLSAEFTRLEGRHNLKFGTDFRIYRAFGNRFPQSTAPDLSFNNTYTRGPLDNSPGSPIGQELASMLAGIPAGTMARSASYATQDRYIAPYLQDDFKISTKLTINLGLRYELELPFTERYDRLVAGFAFNQANPLEAAAQANYAINPIPELPVDQFRVLGGLNFVNQNGNGRSPFKGEKNNFLPRIGLAWLITPKTVLRTGYGIFYDTLGVNSTAPIQTGFSQNTPIQASLDSGLTYIATLANPLPNGLLPPNGPAGGLLTNIGQSISFFDPNMKQPYAQRWSLGLQRELPMGFLLDVSYTGNRGTRLPITRNYNTTPANYLSTSPVRDNATISFLSQSFRNPFYGLDPIFGANITRANLLKPYPEFGDIMVEEPIGYSWYHAMQTRVEKRFSRGFTIQFGWSWSKLMEAVEFLNASDPLPYESIGSFDRTHRITASGIWELPIGKGKKFGNNLPAIANFIAGDWRIGCVVAQQSGPALGFGNRIFNGNLDDIVVPASERTAEHWLNVAGFETASNKQLASNIRTFPLRFSSIRGDGQKRWDFSMTKSWPIREHVKMQFRAEVYNAWNNVNFNTPNTDPTSSAFGTITSTSGDARNWQFAFKLTF
ncbi:MAG: TonB-dependent receptor [Blastocatellia bacterium]|nr:TonB-dependent receptor [Blastocatellia bacterium]